MLTGWSGPGQALEPYLLPARAHLGTRESVWIFCRARERTRLQSGKTGCDAFGSSHFYSHSSVLPEAQKLMGQFP